MYDEHDEELAFWSRVDGPRAGRTSAARRARAPRPTAPSRRPTAAARAPRPTSQPANGRRTHHDDTGPVSRAPSLTGAIPVIAQRAREAHATDPRVRRIVALSVVLLLAVPVALALRSGDEADATAPADLPRFSAAAFAAAATVPPTAPVATDAATAPADAGTTAAEPPATTAPGNPWAAVDVDALAPAVPKHPDATVTAESAATPSTVAPTPKAAPAAKTVVNVNACSKKYTVQAGDAWMLIASKANVTITALLEVNNATARTMLFPGRSVCLPLNATLATGTKRPTSSASGSTSKPSSSSGSSAASATTQPPRPANTYSKAQVEAIIRSVWPDDLEDEAVRIATRESGLNPTVRNYCCYGLFQIYYSVHNSWLATVGVHSAADLYDPKLNAMAAYLLYQRSGSFRPWQ